MYGFQILVKMENQHLHRRDRDKNTGISIFQILSDNSDGEFLESTVENLFNDLIAEISRRKISNSDK